MYPKNTDPQFILFSHGEYVYGEKFTFSVYMKKYIVLFLGLAIASIPLYSLADGDTTAPVINSIGPTGTVLSSVNDIVASRNITEDTSLSGLKVTIYNAAPPNNIIVQQTFIPAATSTTIFTGRAGLSKKFIDGWGADGDYLIEYQATDNAGNVGVATHSFHYTIDTEINDTAPPHIISSFPNNTTVPSVVNFNRQVDDDSIDGGIISFVIAGDPGLNFRVYQDTFTITDNNNPSSTTYYVSLAQGTYYRASTVTDYRGNATGTVVQSFEVDTTPPIVSYTGPTADDAIFITGSSIVVPLAWESTDAHLSGGTYTFQLSTGSWFSTISMTITGDADTNNSIDLSTTPNNGYFWRVIVTDAVGNTTTGDIQKFFVSAPENTAPTIIYTFPSYGQDLTNTAVNFQWIVEDASLLSADATIQVALDTAFSNIIRTGHTYIYGGRWTGTHMHAGIFMPSDGTYYWRIIATDTAGNTTIGSRQYFTINATPTNTNGWGGGSPHLVKDNCSANDVEDASPSFYDRLCDTQWIIPTLHWQKNLSLFQSGMIASDTSDIVTIYGFITDVFKLLHIALRGTMPEQYKTTPLPENIYTKILAALHTLFGK